MNWHRVAVFLCRDEDAEEFLIYEGGFRSKTLASIVWEEMKELIDGLASELSEHSAVRLEYSEGSDN